MLWLNQTVLGLRRLQAPPLEACNCGALLVGNLHRQLPLNHGEMEGDLKVSHSIESVCNLYQVINVMLHVTMPQKELSG